MNKSIRSRVSVIALIAAVGLLSACGAEPDFSVTAVRVDERPAGVEDPAQLPSSQHEDESCDPRASYEPSTSTSGKHLQDILDRGRLIVGVDQNSYLLGYRDPLTGDMAGFDIAIAREIARDLFNDPDAIQFKAISSSERVPVLQEEKVDLVVRSMTMTCPRWDEVAFSSEYYTAGQKVLVSSSSSVENIGELSGEKICAAAGSTSLRRIADAGATPVSVKDWTDCLVLLQQGEVAAISTDDVILAGLAAQDPYTKVVGDALSEEPYAVAANKTHIDLIRFVNSTLKRIQTDGTWNELYSATLQEPLGAASPPEPKYGR